MTKPLDHLPTQAEVEARLAELGLTAAPRQPRVTGPVLTNLDQEWRRACEAQDGAQLRAIRGSYARLWARLPDDRYRQSGNGKVLAEFLRLTEALINPGGIPTYSVWATLPHPHMRPKGAPTIVDTDEAV